MTSARSTEVCSLLASCGRVQTADIEVEFVELWDKSRVPTSVVLPTNVLCVVGPAVVRIMYPDAKSSRKCCSRGGGLF